MASQPGRRERLISAIERDGPRCVWCRCACTGPVRGTTDHLVPKIKGGPSWLENEVLACGRCNAERGHASPVDWLGECERRGWRPDVAAVGPSAARPAAGRSTNAVASVGPGPTWPASCADWPVAARREPAGR